MSNAGLTTRPSVDASGNQFPVIGAQNNTGDFAPAFTVVDQVGAAVDVGGKLDAIAAAVGGEPGTDITGATMPAGGAGERGWLSAIWLWLSGNAAKDSTVQSVATSLGSDGTGGPDLPTGSSGVRGWLRYIASLLSSPLAVTGSVVLGGGSTTIGKVGIDQTAPGTTNGVVVNNGSTGHDWSNGAGTLPNIGGTVGTTTFGGTGPFAAYILVKVIPANPARALIDVENISGSRIAVLRDDGTAAPGQAPNNGTVFALDAGSAAGAQGASWSSTTFRGRIQIYAPSASALVAAMED